jgi:hypothetical protein
MGKVVPIEPFRIKRWQQVRKMALKCFPLAELSELRRELVEPFVRYWPETERIWLTELVYRVAFEAFALGFDIGRHRNHPRLARMHEAEGRDFEKRCDELVSRLVAEFRLFGKLDGFRAEEAVLLLFHTAHEWFAKGIRA